MRLWHGGAPGLKVGDVLVPGERHHVDGCQVCQAKARGESPILDPLNRHEDRLYVTSDREYARFYASKYPRGDLYTVEPVSLDWSELVMVDVGLEDPFPTWAVPAARVVSVYATYVQLTDRQRVALVNRWKRVDDAKGFGANRLNRPYVPRLGR